MYSRSPEHPRARRSAKRAARDSLDRTYRVSPAEGAEMLVEKLRARYLRALIAINARSCFR